MWKVSIIFLGIFTVISASTMPKVRTDGLPFIGFKGQVAASEAQNGGGIQSSSECGGFIDGPMGVINYKPYQNMSFKESCVWTVLIRRKQTMEVQIVEAGYTNCGGCAQVHISNIPIHWSGIKGEFKLAKTIGFYDRSPYNISGYSLFQIALTTTNSDDIEGFTLQFKGIGPSLNASDVNNPIFRVLKPVGSSGLIKYARGLGVENAEFVSLTIHPEVGKEISLTISDVGQWIKIGEPCYLVGSVSVNEVAWAGGSENDFISRFRECRGKRNTTITSSVPMIITYATWRYGVFRGDKFQIEWFSY